MNSKLILTQTVGGRTVRVFQRFLETGYGPTPSQVYYECDAPIDWPRVRVRTKRGLSTLIARLFRGPGMMLDNPRFNRAFRVDAEEEDFAIVLLSPEMQEFMLEKRNVDWNIGYGFVKLIYPGKLKQKKMPASLERIERFWQLVPEELLDW